MAKDLTDKQPTSKEDIDQLIHKLPADQGNTFSLYRINHNQVLQEIKAIRSDCSTGGDSIPINMIKLVADVIASPLTAIINNSIDKNIFPDQWKTAKICPIPKIDNPMESKDFRLISLLPVMSKVFERIIMKQLIQYIENRTVYSDMQSGFRKNHSANTLLIKMRDDILNAMDKGEVTIAVLTDFSKAFDTVDYPTLLKKLHALNMSKNTLKLMASYLTERQQYVQIDDKLSTSELVTFGVPQGSILGPVLFNLYVSDMDENCKNCACAQYADDSNLYKNCKPSNIMSSINYLEETLNDVYKWSEEKNLIFNPDKTKFMIFTTTRSKHKDIAYQFRPDERTTVERSDSNKILGIWFQQQLCWDNHIAEVTRSCYTTICVLRKIKHLANRHLRKQLCNSLILSRLDYCSTVFDPLTTNMEKRLQKVQNSATALILNRYCSTKDVLTIGWLPIKERTEMKLACLCHQAAYNECFPPYMRLEFDKRRLPRACNDNGPKIVEKGHRNTFHSRAARVFNELPRDLRETKKVELFKINIKKYFLNRAKERLS